MVVLSDSSKEVTSKREFTALGGPDSFTGVEARKPTASDGKREASTLILVVAVKEKSTIAVLLNEGIPLA